MSHRDHTRSLLARLGGVAGIILACSGLLRAQEAVRSGMAYFPADTQQIAYSSFAQLRSSQDYTQIRRHVLFQQLRGFQEFLHSLGIIPEKDVDEVMLGWRGESPSGPGSFGVAVGRFEPDKVRELFVRTQLPVQSYDGCDLYAFGSGADQDDTFFTFLDSTLAAFGRLHDLKALLDVREGYAQPLESNQALQGYEAELEGTSPQWGILTGKAAANVATPWLAGGKNTSVDLTAFLQPVQAVLYRIDWDGGFTAHISVVCKSPESATGLFQLLNLLKSAPVFAAATGGTAPSPIIQNLDAHQEGPRLELSASGPADALDQLIH
ncbi:MAG: hypothetical protein ABSF46_07040 [Terriglobia bacterium]